MNILKRNAVRGTRKMKKEVALLGLYRYEGSHIASLHLHHVHIGLLEMKMDTFTYHWGI